MVTTVCHTESNGKFKMKLSLFRAPLLLSGVSLGQEVKGKKTYRSVKMNLTCKWKVCGLLTCTAPKKAIQKLSLNKKEM